MEEDELSEVREDGELGGKFCLSQIKESGLYPEEVTSLRKK